mmetsp:Transcript_51201/g.101414  ORF Transcript_51201/g.101414 Transcript_51201/m.101414 type:complete len:245 (-) Transcript_51201:439-1173(-)
MAPLSPLSLPVRRFVLGCIAMLRGIEFELSLALRTEKLTTAADPWANQKSRRLPRDGVLRAWHPTSPPDRRILADDCPWSPGTAGVVPEGKEPNPHSNSAATLSEDCSRCRHERRVAVPPPPAASSSAWCTSRWSSFRSPSSRSSPFTFTATATKECATMSEGGNEPQGSTMIRGAPPPLYPNSYRPSNSWGVVDVEGGGGGDDGTGWFSVALPSAGKTNVLLRWKAFVMSSFSVTEDFDTVWK